MEQSQPNRPVANPELLFGILALQMDFVTQDGLVAAMHAWVVDKTRPLGQLLVERGALRTERRRLLDDLVQAHLEAHDGDEEKSLAALGVKESVRESLRQLADPDVQASLQALNPGGAEDPNATRTFEENRSALGSRYILLRPHARGGLGQVFVAEDTELHREVAVKQMHDGLAADASSRRRFLQEAEITGNLEHPAIVPVYGLGHHADGQPYYVMRFIRGDSLREAIRHFHASGDGPAAISTTSASPGTTNRRLALRHLLKRFIDMCNAVAYAHSRGIVHRDLKPANVMLGKFGETLVVDWGLAKSMERQDDAPPSDEPSLRPISGSGTALTQAGAAVGTPAYMSPEQASGRLEELGPASDVYSLGATLYCLLTGAPPLRSDDVGEVLRRVERGDIPPPRSINPQTPAPLDAICRRAMATKPADRYPSALALAEDIEHWLADEPVNAYRDPWPQRLGRWARRHRPIVAGCAVALVAASVFLGVLSMVLDQARRTSQAEEARTAAAHRAAVAARHKTREALDQVASEVIDKLLTKIELSAAHKAFLRKALALYQDLAEQPDTDPQNRAEIAEALYRMADIRARLGEHEDVATALQRCIELSQGLVVEFPAGAEHRKRLALAHDHLGDTLQVLNRRDDSLRSYTSARENWQRLVIEFPNQPGYRQGLAHSLQGRGVAWFKAGRLHDSETTFLESLTILEQLVKEHPKIAEYRSELGGAYNRTSQTLQLAGKPREAGRLLAEAVACFRSLAAEKPHDFHIVQELAAALNNLGVFQYNAGKNGDARAVFAEALALRKQLTVDYPALPEFKKLLGHTYNNLAMVVDASERLELQRSSVALYRQLARDYPKVREFRQDLGMGLHNLASQLRKKEPAEAQAAYRESQLIFERLLTELPADPLPAHSLAWSHLSFGSLLIDQNRSHEAKWHWLRSIQIMRPVVAANPNVPEYQHRLADGLGKLAHEYTLKNQHRIARDYRLEQVRHADLAQQAHPDNRSFGGEYRDALYRLALQSILLKDHREATAAAERLAAATNRSAEQIFQAACVFSMCVPSIAKDQSLPESERTALAEEYADKAMATLRAAYQAGFPKTRRIDANPELKSLRGRQDFQALLKELQNK